MAQADDEAFLKKYGGYTPQPKTVPVTQIKPILGGETAEEAAARRAGEGRAESEEQRRIREAQIKEQELLFKSKQETRDVDKFTQETNQKIQDLQARYRGYDSYKKYTAAAGLYNAGLYTQPNTAGDLDLITYAAKMRDPTTGVLGGEAEQTKKIETYINQVKAEVAKQFGWKEGGTLTPEGRNFLRNSLRNAFENNYRPLYLQDREFFKQEATASNFDPMRIVGPDPYEAYKESIEGYWAKQPQEEMEAVEFTPNPNLVVGEDGRIYDRRTGQPVEVNPQDQDSLGQAFYAGVGDIAQGLGEMAGIVANPANAAVNALFGTELSTDLGQTFREATGAPQGDPLASAINRAGVAGLTSVGGAGLLARTLPTVGARDIAATLATQPAQQIAANVGGGAAAEVVRQQGGGTAAQIAATIAGGIPAAGAVNLGQSFMRAAPEAISSFRGAPQATSATTSAADQPFDLLAELRAFGEGGTPSAPTSRAPLGNVSVRELDQNQKMYLADNGAQVTVMEDAKFAPRNNSITDFVVPEGMRGGGVGGELLDNVLSRYDPMDVSAAASSDPSVALFYNRGFRPASNPRASLEDALAIRREDSSVTMVIPRDGQYTPGGGSSSAAPRMFEAGETVTSRAGGAMGTSPEQIRLMQAEGLPVPVQLTRGAAARDPEQLAFEKEQIFSELGGPLRRRAEENNLQALQNFDRFIDMTGAEAPDIASTGNAVIKALSQGYQASKNRVRTAYTEADKAGETAELVSYNGLVDFINQQTPTTRTSLAPILQSTLEKLRMEDPSGSGLISIRALEDVRKAVNKAVQPGTPNATYGTAIKDLIDTATEGVGGDLYKRARQLRIDQADKFEKRAIVARLVSNIKNMDDRRVPADRVFKTAILNESPENIQFLRKTLRDLGDDGKQAWSELQGATLRHIQERATANVNKTAENLDVISAAQLNKAVDELDKNGRLDLIFNPKMAQQVRDLRDVVQYVNTVPPGTSINTSGTARTLAAALGEMVVTGTTTSIPLPILTGIKVIRDQIRDAKIKKQINRSLLPRGEQD